LPAGTTGFSADEQNFFRQGEAIESGEFHVDDLTERKRRPRLILIGAAVGVAVLVLSLVVGQRSSVDAIAAVRAPTPPMNLPSTEAPAPEAVAIATPSADEGRAVKAKKSKPAHQNRAAARGKHR
jgi:hypothetical protein